MLGKPGKVSMVQIAALCSNCPVEKIVAQVGGVLPGTRVTAMQEKVKNRMHAIDQFRTFSWIVAGVIVVIEALVVFVTMMGSVNARTREIGIFRALGFRRGHVTGLILIEAAAASLLAGVLGYLAGMGVSYALLPLLGGGGVAVTWTPALAGGGRRPGRRSSAPSPRCTRRCTPAASTPPSPCGRCERGRRMTLFTIAVTNLRRRKARAAFLVAGLLIGVGTVVALISLTQSMTRPDQGQPAELRRQHRDHAASPGTWRSATAASPPAASPWARSPSPQADLARIDTIPSRADISVVAPELVGAVQVKGKRALLLGVKPGAAVQAQALVVGGRRARAGERPRARGRLGGGRRARPADGRLRAHRRPALHRDRRPARRRARRTTAC